METVWNYICKENVFIDDVYKYYDYYNERYFNNELPLNKEDIHIILVNTKACYVGRACNITHKKSYYEIQLNKHYLDKYYKLEMIDTLIHEMIHIWQFVHHNKKGGHGKDFQFKCAQINKQDNWNLQTQFNGFIDDFYTFLDDLFENNTYEDDSVKWYLKQNYKNSKHVNLKYIFRIIKYYKEINNLHWDDSKFNINLISELEKTKNSIIKYIDFDHAFDGEEQITLILKCILDDHIFICNRNSNQFKNIFNDKYVHWWEAHQVNSMNFDIVNKIQLLEKLPLSNENLKDQREINSVKITYINKLDGEDGDKDNETSCNILFNEAKDNYRRKYREQYKEFLDIINSDSIDKDDLYDCSKKLFWGNYKFDETKDEIWNKVENKRHAAMIILLRDYIYYKKYILKCKEPWTKHQIPHIKSLLLNKIKLIEKEKETIILR